MNEQGKPLFFDVDKYLDSVEGMINADEVERAFWMLDNMPSFYRDNIPPRAKWIKERLNYRLVTPIQYGSEVYGPVTLEEVNAHWPVRAELVYKFIKDMNEQGVEPNVMEMSPGSQWMKVGLEGRKVKFLYEHMSLSGEYLNDTFDRPNMFICFEVIEHLSDTSEIYRNYLKFNKKAHLVMISTPLYTINGGQDKWESRPLGHLRTYTPGEFLKWCQGTFQEHKFEIITGEEMVAMGVKNEGT